LKRRIRIRFGGFLLIIPVPQLTDYQKKTVIALLISFFINLLFTIPVTLFLKPAKEPKPLSEDEKMVLLNLRDDEEIKKAKELIDNPKANDIKPKDSKILSERNSKTDLKEIPEGMKNSKMVAVIKDEPKSENKEKTKENPKDEKTQEDEFKNNQNIFPFLKSQTNRSLREAITGQPEGEEQKSLGQTYELNTYAWEFAPYMLKWKNKMTAKWYQITAKIIFNPFAKLGSMRIYVKMNKQGRLLDSRIIDYNCDYSFVAPAYASVVNSFPLDPLPDGFPNELLETTWTITITN
jgi:hypothetical protein